MKSKSKIFTFIAMTMMLAFVAIVFAGPAGAQEEAQAAEPVPAGNSKYQLEAADGEAISLTEPANYIVQLDAPPVASYKGGIAGLAATNPATLGTNKLTNSDATQAYVSYLQDVQTAFLNEVNSTLSRDVDVVFTYQHAFNGVAVKVTPLEAERIAKLDGVRMVVRETIEEILTDVGPAWIGAPGIWDGSEAPAGLSTMGEGVVVAILDTGINSLHPSFADVGEDGYDHTNPLGAGIYLGVCDPANPDYQAGFVCNDKLIGVHDFIDGVGNDPDSPEDGDGHGSHTASTVAGNVVTATLYAPTASISDTISGVAPHANIIAYDVCLNGPASAGGGCSGAALLAAVNQVVVDTAVLPNGIAAINYSISGGSNPYADPVELAFLAATDAGVFVSASAGNEGPGPSTVAHVSPWVATIAASTHNRSIMNNVTSLTSDGGGLSDISGVGFTAGYGPAPLLYAGDFGDALCLNPFPGGTFSGEIVVCDRGTNARVDKGSNVLAGGAGGMILADDGNGPVSDAHFLPATHISQADGTALKTWMAANTNAVGTITGAILDYDPSNGDIMAGFSSRGPVGIFDVLKPDVTAPGVSIWAAVNDDGSGPDDYGFLSGTSMSSPHNAGAATLMAALYPTWTPHQIKSAMMLSADNVDNFKEDGTTPVDPFDVGAGRIQVNWASSVGFVLDETTENFENADPALNNGSESLLRDLNVASLSNNSCVGSCTWTRTVQSVLSSSATYTATVSAPAGVVISVDPPTFTLAAGGTQVLEISADVSGATVGDWAFGSVSFETNATVPDLNTAMTVALSEGFEGAWPPTGWTVITDTNAGWNTNTFWGKTNNTPGADGQAAGADSDAFGDALDTTLLTPVFDLTGYATANLTFDSNFQDFAGGGDAWVDISTDGGTNWTNIHFMSDDEPPAGTSYLYDLSSYVGGTAQLRFRFMTPGWDWYWYIDDVVVNAFAAGSNPVAPMSMPIAVIPSAGNLPSLIEVETRRDAGSNSYDGLQAVEITDSQVAMYGPTEATLDTATLPVDPTNGFPYDDLSQVFYTTFTVPADAKRMVAEITASESPDLDMFWGSGSTPSAATELGFSATGTAFEYLSADNPPAGTYWVLVQNWDDSSPGAHDAFTLATAVVPDTDSGLATFDMPTAVPAGDLFSADLNWTLTDSEAGDHFYGAMDLGTDAGTPDDLGRTDINIVRLDDDVMKEASAMNAEPGDVVTYTITIAANTGDTPLTYSITDTIPAGLTYVPGSATGGATVNGNVLTWSGTQVAPVRDYLVSTSLTDPTCTMPLANSGRYVNLEAFGFLANNTITGNGYWQDAGYGGGPYAFYGDNSGNDTGTALYFNGDGFVTLDADSVLAGPFGTNSDLPDAALPNALLSMIWNSDIQIVYESGTGANNRGVTTGIQLSNSGVPTAKLLEFDDVELVGDSSSRADIEMMIREAIDDTAGVYEIVFAYDNLTGQFASGLAEGTIGVENFAGDRGTVYAYDDANLATLVNGMAVCFDWAIPPVGAHVITYQATVDGDVEAGTILTNVVDHVVDAPGTAMETAEATIEVSSAFGIELAPATAALSGAPGSVVTYTLMLTNTGNITDTFSFAAAGNSWATALPADVTLGAGASAMVDVAVTVDAAAGDGDTDVATVTATSAGDSSVTAESELTTTAVVTVTDYIIYMPVVMKP
jgi:uncharacterized repeat protein (TIGR01451 family)